MLITKFQHLFFILIILSLSSLQSNASNIEELKTSKLQNKSAKLSCNCEYKLNSININWWDNFSDPYLKHYIEQALLKNHNVKKQELITEEYRQNVKKTFAKELPSLTLAPTFARIKTPAGGFADIEMAQSRTNIYSIPLIANYEADIFLKNHDKTKSAKAEKDAKEYKEKALNITLATEVATTYINILKLDKIIETQENIAKIREEIFELTKERNKAGLASVYDVTYTDKLHTQALIELNDLKKEQNIYLNKLAIYIDENPFCSENLARSNFDKLEYIRELPTYINSDIVLLRPDIMEIESKLKKAKIDISIAKKEFLPTIPILGIVGYNSTLLKRLLNWESIIALVGVSAFEKIYTGGNLIATLRTNKIKFEQLLEEYKQTELVALQEINDSLCNIKFNTQKDNEQIKKLKLEKSNIKLIEYRYKAGIISYLDYIQYKETLLSLQIEQDNSKAQRLIDYISLYKATGTKL